MLVSMSPQPMLHSSRHQGRCHSKARFPQPRDIPRPRATIQGAVPPSMLCRSTLSGSPRTAHRVTTQLTARLRCLHLSEGRQAALRDTTDQTAHHQCSHQSGPRDNTLQVSQDTSQLSGHRPLPNRPTPKTGPRALSQATRDLVAHRQGFNQSGSPRRTLAASPVTTHLATHQLHLNPCPQLPSLQTRKSGVFLGTLDHAAFCLLQKAASSSMFHPPRTNPAPALLAH